MSLAFEYNKEATMGNFKITKVALAPRGHWATSEDEEYVYKVASEGVIGLHIQAINGEGETRAFNVDLLLALSSEGASIIENTRVQEAMKEIGFSLVGLPIPEKAFFAIPGGTGWRLSMSLTRKIRKVLIGVEDVPVSWQYIKKLKEGFYKKLNEGRVPKDPTFIKLRDNPRIKIGEWKEALYSRAYNY
jgi:hypothetical protein